MRDTEQELEFHLEMLTRRYVEQGLDPEAARAKALARMGDLAAAGRESRAIERQTDAGVNRMSWMQALAQDLRHAVRILRRSPGYVAIAVAMIALGTGASATVFSVVDGVILRSPFSRVEDMALLRIRNRTMLTSAIPLDTYVRLTSSPLPAPVLALGTITGSSPVVTGVDTPRRTQVECLSASMVDVMATPPLRGRWFSAADAAPGAPPVGVVGHDFWRNTLAGDPNVIGRVIALDDAPLTIIGVMSAGFDGPHSLVNRDIWVPMDPQSAGVYGCRTADGFVTVVARVRPGVLMADAAAALNAGAGVDTLSLSPIEDDSIGDLKAPFAALVGAVIAVLLIAVANVTNLSLERLTGRRQELAVRMALGASRGRVIRESIAEHVLVASAGALAGVLVAVWSFDAMMGLLPASLPNLDAINLNGRVLTFTIGVALLGGVVAGSLAASQATPALRAGLASGDRGQTSGHTRTRRLLVIGELALGVVLLVGALLMVRTFLTLRPGDPGFDPTDKQLALVRLPSEMPLQERRQFIQRVGDELQTIPGIRAVATTTSVPMRRSVAVRPVEVGGSTSDVYTGIVSPNYFQVLDIPVRRGRVFTGADNTEGLPVAVVNETFAKRWFGDGNPLGETLTLYPGTGRASTLTIVGVIGDIRSFGGDTRVRPFAYTPAAQSEFTSAFFVVHTDARAAATLPASIRRLVSRARPGQLVDEVEALVDEMGDEVAQPRLGAWLFSVFAGLAVLLGAVGLGATLAWMVAARRRELGIRMALGARPRDVRRLVVGQSLSMTIVGVSLGLLLAAGSTRLLEGWLYGVTPLDPWTFGACTALMLTVSAIAAYVPARRATGIDPIIALRAD